ncbi:MAG TPA: hypothetical protein PKV75_11055 [Desulfobacterales bacterium]|nr:hypothetical protein [Desulfobacterales bacterium]
MTGGTDCRTGIASDFGLSVESTDHKALLAAERIMFLSAVSVIQMDASIVEYLSRK